MTVTVVAGEAGARGPARVGRYALEFWVVVGAAGAGLAWLPLGRIRAQVGRWRLAAIGLFSAALVVAQFVPGLPHPYPLARWNMYTTPTSAGFYSQYVVVTDGEAGRHLPIHELLSAVSSRAVLANLNAWTRRTLDGDPNATAVLSTTLAKLVRSAGHDDAEAVEIRFCAVREPTVAEPSRCETVLIVELDPEA